MRGGDIKSLTPKCDMFLESPLAEQPGNEGKVGNVTKVGKAGKVGKVEK